MVSSTFVGPVIPYPSGQLAELVVYITSTSVDLYSHRILFNIQIINYIYTWASEMRSIWDEMY